MIKASPVSPAESQREPVLRDRLFAFVAPGRAALGRRHLPDKRLFWNRHRDHEPRFGTPAPKAVKQDAAAA